MEIKVNDIKEAYKRMKNRENLYKDKINKIKNRLDKKYYESNKEDYIFLTKNEQILFDIALEITEQKGGYKYNESGAMANPDSIELNENGVYICWYSDYGRDKIVHISYEEIQEYSNNNEI